MSELCLKASANDQSFQFGADEFGKQTSLPGDARVMLLQRTKCQVCAAFITCEASLSKGKLSAITVQLEGNCAKDN